MKYISRQIESVCLQDLKSFPVLTVTGPRQCGKSTMLRKVLGEWTYVNLEDPGSLDFAVSDPEGFLRTYSDRVVIDEIQRAPKLLSYIQVAVDRDRRPGRFALTGSHNLLLVEQVSQSLAGRTAVRHLLPFSYDELHQKERPTGTIEEAMFFGGYPPVLEFADASSAWLDSYIQTYVERDVRMIRNVADLTTFRRFVRLCAGRASQLVDLSGLGGDAGVTHNTARSWIGVLEASFIAFRLEPFYKNFSKRIIKSPKLYFYDTGLLCRVLDIRTAKELETHPFRGAVFENWCVVEALKSFHNRGARPGIYFWRDQTMEVDLLLELSSTAVAAIECKSGITPPGDALKTPQALRSIMKGYEVVPAVIFGGEATQRRSDGILFGWKDFAMDLTRPGVSIEGFGLAKK